MATVITAGNATNGLSFTADNTGSLDIKTGTGAGTTALSLSSSQIATFAGAASVPGNLSFNSGYGSSAVAYGCRAWVNFDGTTNTGGFCTIRASGNVTSITDNGVGDYTVNLTTAMPDINYSVALVANAAYGVDRSCHPALFTNISAATEAAPTTTSFKVGFSNIAGSAGQDLKYISVAVFR